MLGGLLRDPGLHRFGKVINLRVVLNRHVFCALLRRRVSAHPSACSKSDHSFALRSDFAADAGPNVGTYFLAVFGAHSAADAGPNAGTYIFAVFCPHSAADSGPNVGA